MRLDAGASSGGVEVGNTLGGSVLAAGSGLGLESLVQLIGMLLLVLGLFAAFAWAVKRWRLLPQLRGAQNRLQILEVRSLGQRNSLMVVGYEEQRFLIGTSNAGLKLISQLPEEENSNGQADGEDAEGPVGEGAEAKEPRAGFLSGMNRHIGKEGA
ncbi:MAG: FliO/MopB family protein [Verrucomicrobia bacterium]|nr:FliO/MopB family protein [Verrucomicrobiota bacterium]